MITFDDLLGFVLALVRGALWDAPSYAYMYFTDRDGLRSDADWIGHLLCWGALSWVIGAPMAYLLSTVGAGWLAHHLGGVAGIGLVVFYFFGWMRGLWGGGDADKHLRGAMVITGAKGRVAVGQLAIGGVPVPMGVEALSFMVAGSPGTGKSLIINRNLDPIRARGDRVIMADAGGEAMARWWQDGDTLLNPLDARAADWSPFAEMEGEWDADRLARSIIPDGEGSADEWARYSQALVSAVLRRLWERNEATNERFIYYLTIAKAEEIEELVRGLPAQTLFDAGAAKMLSSIRGIIGANLGAFAYLSPSAGPQSYSIRRWLREGSGWLWMPYRDDMRASLAPLIRTWCDVAVSSVLSERPSSERKIWLIVDELAALGRISALTDAMAQGRKYGLRVVAGLQSIAQLVTSYGPKGAETLLACFQTWAILRVSDAQTAEAMSRQLGDREILRTETSESRNDQGTSTSEAVRHVNQRVVLASEIQTLPDRIGFLKFAGDYPIARVAIPIVQKSEVIPPFEPQQREAVVTSSPSRTVQAEAVLAAPERLEL